MSLLLNRRDLEFVLYELLQVEALAAHPRYAGQDRALYDATLDAAEKLAAEKFAPHAAELDEHEPSFDGERVHLIPQVKEALDAYVEAGFMGASLDADLGGMQIPWTVAQVCAAYFSAANVSTAAYPFITIAACNLLGKFGSEEQKRRYLAPMVAGRYFGTMVLSEPQAGSSLADIRTRAVPTAQGHYLLTGNKMWTSAAEHDLAENIVHLVLAKIPGGPPGVKGISLFIVPKYLVGDDGRLGARNDARVAGLNHKMGYRGTVNAVFNLGEQGECRGWLLGEPHQGLSYMFHMMNEARIGVGLGAVALGTTGYLHSLRYARERPQGRHPDNKDPASPMLPIVEHADIRRLLLAQKATVEGGLALELYCSWLIDCERTASDAAARDRLALLLDLLTPIAKSWPSEFCLEANKHAIQILGGYGYTRDYPLERFYRDNRLNPIHEGAHGIHGIDLLGRKLAMRGGAAFELLLAELDATLAAAAALPALAEYVACLRAVRAALIETTAALGRLRDGGELTRALANAGVYLDTFGHVVIGWLWLKMAVVAAQAVARASGSERDFYLGKLQACRYFYRYELAKVPERLALLARADDTCLAMQDAWF
ncbi:MAG TPA: acyl-CoA dehydrogenase [Gammaproteobacteria bacterium]|nr:acyl-CoA dehydrogenase [Gammaproteobacteria bacterium]